MQWWKVLTSLGHVLWPVHLKDADASSIEGIMPWLGRQPVMSCVSTRRVYTFAVTPSYCLPKDGPPVWACGRRV
jgi:hypothetical protein